MKRYKQLTIAVCVLGISLSGMAQVPQFINYQGRLLMKDGTPMNNVTNDAADGQIDLVFQLYDALNNGTSVWGQTNEDVAFNNGLFSVLLAGLNTNHFPTNAGVTRWLEVEVRYGTTTNSLGPRKEIVSVAYAIRASDADRVDGYHAEDIVATATNRMVENDPTVVNWVKDGVRWDELKGVQGMPAGFADGVDNEGITTETDPTVISWVKDGVKWDELKGVQGMPAGFADGVDNEGITSETDPKVGANTPNYVPRWDGPAGALVSGNIYNDPNNGNIGIGTTSPSPSYKLDVNGWVRSGLLTAPQIYVINVLSIGTVLPLYPLDVNGNARISGRLYLGSYEFISSDDRIKFNEQKLDYGLAQVMALEPKRYDRAEWEVDPETEELVIHPEKTTVEIGLIAQEVQKVIPEAVSVPENENCDLWSTSYSTLIPVLVKAIQEQQTQIEALKQENQTLVARVAPLESGSLIDTPLTADFDGDGKADTALVSASGGWYFWLSGSGYVKSGPYNLGMNGKPVAADYDGDGKADPGMVDSNGNLYVWLSASGYSQSKL